MANYTKELSSDNASLQGRLKRNVVRAMQEEVTPRQRQCMTLYYAQGLNMTEIGAQLGLDKSTVSRNIKRGEERLRRCLRYGAELFLCQNEED